MSDTSNQGGGPGPFVSPAGSGSAPAAAVYPPGYLNGFQMTMLYTSGTFVVTVEPGFASDSAGVTNIVSGIAMPCDIAASGAGGLDTGSISDPNWYAVYVISDSTGALATNVVASLNHVGPLLPPGFDAFRRVGSVRIAASGAPPAIVPFFSPPHQGIHRRFIWRFAVFPTALFEGTSATFADVDLSRHIPTTATDSELEVITTKVAGISSSAQALIVPDAWNESSSRVPWLFYAGENSVDDPTTSGFVYVPNTTGSQLIRYRVVSANVSIGVKSYHDGL